MVGRVDLLKMISREHMLIHVSDLYFLQRVGTRYASSLSSAQLPSSFSKVQNTMEYERSLWLFDHAHKAEGRAMKQVKWCWDFGVAMYHWSWIDVASLWIPSLRTLSFGVDERPHNTPRERKHKYKQLQWTSRFSRRDCKLGCSTFSSRLEIQSHLQTNSKYVHTPKHRIKGNCGASGKRRNATFSTENGKIAMRSMTTSACNDPARASVLIISAGELDVRTRLKLQRPLDGCLCQGWAASYNGISAFGGKSAPKATPSWWDPDDGAEWKSPLFYDCWQPSWIDGSFLLNHWLIALQETSKAMWKFLLRLSC